MDKDQLIRTITTTHDELVALVERISDDHLLGPAMDEWTGKDVLAHIAWWQDHSARLTEDYHAGREPDEMTHPAGTTDEINESVYREHNDDSPALTRDSLVQTFNRLVDAIEPLSDDDLFGADRCHWLDGGALSEMILWDTSRHYQQHSVHLRTLLDENP